MSHWINKTGYAIRYGFNRLFGRMPLALVAGIPLTDRCNLTCKHCVVYKQGKGHNSFAQITAWMQALFGRGARMLYLQGGEPFLWEDQGLDVESVLAHARKIGFFLTALVTNGTFSIKTSADRVWISVDGVGPVHEAIRGPGTFEKLLTNLSQSTHSWMAANVTLNVLNIKGLEETVRFVAGHPKLKGISVNFHTPYPGTESLCLDVQQRSKAIHKLLELKRAGMPVLNSWYGLKALQCGKYKRPIDNILMVEQGKIFVCCWGRQYKGVCDLCGYGVISELVGVHHLRPSAILQAIKLFR